MDKVKIIFASCTRYDVFDNQPEWEEIENENPDYLFLLGDNIYMDYGIWPFSDEPNYSPKKLSDSEFETKMNYKYQQQWNEPHFKSLFEKMKAKKAVFGIWDDHDFAWNDSYGNHTNPKDKHAVPESKKNISRRLFNYWMYGKENCDDDIYQAIDIPMGKAIFLDNRYYAQEPDKANKLIGDIQMNFLKEQLEHDKQYTIICSGLSLTQGKECWSKYEEEYNEFCSLVDRQVVFLAGDIHRNDYIKPLSKIKKGNLSSNCHEVISSGVAINYFGLPFKWDDVHNWGMLEYDENEMLVTFVDKSGHQRPIKLETSN